MGLRARQNRQVQQYVAPTSFSTSMGASFELGARDRETNAIAEMKALSDLQGRGEKLSIADLNKEYPDTTFSGPSTMLAAQYISDSQKERKRNEEIVSNTDGFLAGTVAPFLSRTVSAMLDPIGFGIGIATGFGASKMAAAVGKKALSSSLGFKLADNLIGNTIAESLVYTRDREQGMDYTAAQMMANVIGGTVLFTGALHGLGKGLGKLRNIKGDPLRKTLYASNTAAIQGKSPTKIATILEANYAKDLEIDGNFKGAMDEVFPGKYGDAENVHDVFSAIKQDLKDGVISEEDAMNFQKGLVDNGVSPEKYAYVEDDVKTEVGKEYRDQVREVMENKEGDYGYDPDADKIREELPETFDDVKLNEELDAQTDLKMAELERREASPEAVKTMDKLAEADKQDIDQFKQLEDYANCIIKGGL